MEAQQGLWLECIVNRDYEIWSIYPFQIRRRDNKRIVKEGIDNSTGYIQCCLSGKKCYKHRIVAIQFLPNPNNLSDIDHINGVRTDNRLCNLRWVSHRDNMRNQSSRNGKPFVFVEQIPTNATPLSYYNKHQFENLYVDRTTQKLYLFNGVRIKELEPVRLNGRSSNYYYTTDTEGKQCKLCHNRLFEDTEEDL